MRRGTPAAAIALAVAISASGFGRLVMMTGAAAATRLGVARDLDAGPGQFPAARRADVVADDAPAGGDQIAGERAAHDAEADHADGASCSASPGSFPNSHVRFQSARGH